jgi:hypothetical protein
MNGYTPPDPDVAEKVHRDDREAREHHRRLEHAPSEQLRRVLGDPAEPVAARASALLGLLLRRDAAVPELLPGLFEDPAMGPLAIRYCPLSDPKAVERLRGLLNHSRERVWSGAAAALARAKDEALRPRLLDWFHKGDERHRNVAIEGLIELDASEAAVLFRESWECGGRDEGDRLVLAAALLRLGDPRGLGALEAAAQRAEGAWSVFAATAIASHDPARGCRLMQGILDHGDSGAQQALVMHAWNLAGLPHAFTADGIHETRLWVEQQLQEHEARN